MPAADPVKGYLKKRGSAEHVVRGGLPGLLARWEGIVDQVAAGYPVGLDDYLDDMDVRDLVEGALRVAAPRAARGAAARLSAADARLKALVVPAGSCLWGEEAAREHGWTPRRQWWYFSVPKRPGEELAADLRDR